MTCILCYLELVNARQGNIPPCPPLLDGLPRFKGWYSRPFPSPVPVRHQVLFSIHVSWLTFCNSSLPCVSCWSYTIERPWFCVALSLFSLYPLINLPPRQSVRVFSRSWSAFLLTHLIVPNPSLLRPIISKWPPHRSRGFRSFLALCLKFQSPTLTREPPVSIEWA